MGCLTLDRIEKVWYNDLMDMNKLCNGKLNSIIVEKPKRCNEDVDYFGYFNFLGVRPSNVKRIRLQCPICGRRVWSSISQNDGEIYHQLPLHKPKQWWKKKKNVDKHKERNIR